MNGPQGRAYYMGVKNVVQAEIDVIHGITPSVATLTIAPQPGFIPLPGYLVITYGTQRIMWHDCKVLDVGFSRTEQGEYWQLHIADRRWKWIWGAIWGRYNLRKDNGEIEGFGTPKSSEKTPQELAKLCLDAMGEGGYDISAIPNDTRPEVEWDFVPPAEALADLCDNLGCRIVLGLDGRVRIMRSGQGSEMPTGDTMIENNVTGDPPEMPDQIAIVTGRSRYQCDFPLEAVGEDIDGSIKPIDKLSYAPTNKNDVKSWANYQADPLKSDFENLEASSYHMQQGWDSEKLRELAKSCVYRWYRIKPPCFIMGFGLVNDLEDILPIETEQVATSEPVDGSEKKNLPAAVHGMWCPGEDSMANTVEGEEPTRQMTPSSQYKLGFSIDTNLGIVKLSKGAYRNSDYRTAAASAATVPEPFTRAPALLYLRTACGVREEGTRAPLRYVRWRGAGSGNVTPARCVIHDEIIRQFYPKYSGGLISGLVDNVEDVDKECDYYLDALYQEYRDKRPQTVRYIGLARIEPDGAIEQVSFSVSPQGTTTTASRNTEESTAVVPYRQRRALERQRKAARSGNEDKPAARRRQERYDG